MFESKDGYQPNALEIKQAESMMTEEQMQSSAERSRWFGRESRFESRAAAVEQYLGLPPNEKAEMAIAMDDDLLEGVYGEGYPLNLVFHEWDGLTNEVAPHSFMSISGATIVETMKEAGASAEKIESAQALVGNYEEHSQKIIAKSETLKKLLEPVDPISNQKQKLKDEGLFKTYSHLMSEEEKGTASKRMGEVYSQPVSDEEIDYLAKILGEGNSRIGEVKKEKTRGAYQGALEPEFGRLFRRFAIQSETPEEFAEYRQKMKAAYEKLVTTA